MTDMALTRIAEQTTKALSLAHLADNNLTERRSANTMTDAALIRIAEETIQALSPVVVMNLAHQMVPSYHALLQAAKANHPNDPFIGGLSPLEFKTDNDYITVGEMIALFAQLRIALESLQSENADEKR
jgi:hypothetical protein